MKLLLKSDNAVRVIADSAIARNSQPWFLPDFGENWRWRTALAFRIGKLGKNVASRFADRYLDAVTLLWVAEADGFGACDYMDGAVVCGNWIPLNEVPEAAASLLADVTCSATIKHGDILAIMNPGESTPISINDHISLSLDETEVLNFNVK